jgi:predicted O-linked N-acetylglucosamine transferase (SPINDLY family)
LLAGVFERHDRKRFETIAISLETDNSSEMLSRLKGSFDRFIDASKQNDIEVARLLRALEVDIIVDLMGNTQNSHPAILAHRPSPIQVNYLGYPGTTGADYIDYIIADRFAIPGAQQQHYSEKVIYLPDTFQANDSKRHISDRTPSRADAGLPANAFIFCAFNNTYKITPTLFDVWMRLLREIDGGVLWLLGANPHAERNLKKEAESRGVHSARLVFASRIAYSDYLARYRLADLFLDTFPFNAGTTASDALWAGLPLVTCSGETFASRMAGSLLGAIGIPEMITHSMTDYEALASKFARDPTFRASIKAKLDRNRLTCPLFDTERFTRHLEAAYVTIRQR